MIWLASHLLAAHDEADVPCVLMAQAQVWGDLTVDLFAITCDAVERQRFPLTDLSDPEVVPPDRDATPADYADLIKWLCQRSKGAADFAEQQKAC